MQILSDEMYPMSPFSGEVDNLAMVDVFKLELGVVLADPNAPGGRVRRSAKRQRLRRWRRG